MNIDRATRWTAEYQRLGALWIHDDNPKRPHALLTSGKHSSGFFNSGMVCEVPFLIEDADVDDHSSEVRARKRILLWALWCPGRDQVPHQERGDVRHLPGTG